MAENNSTQNYSSRTDLIGKQFGRWTVLRKTEIRKSRCYWQCLCDCGMEVEVDGKELRIGRSNSCIRCRNRTHGKVTAPEYMTWKRMRGRCNNTAHKDYRHYGGRGIHVCQEWDSFETFYHDMGLMPSPLHTLERIDNSGNYEPDNCRWATRKEQARNTRRNRLLTFNGITQSVPEWSDETGIPQKILHTRLIAGWTVEEALMHPVGRRRLQCNRLLTLGGTTMCLADWAKQRAIHPATLAWRLGRGWSVERALTTPTRQRLT